MNLLRDSGSDGWMGGLTLGARKIVAFAAYTILVYLLYGFVLSTLWGWYVEPAFNIPGLNIPEPTGITIIIGFLTSNYNEIKPDTNLVARGTYGLTNPLFALLAGWVIHFFV